MSHFEEVDGKVIFSLPMPPTVFQPVTSIELPELFADLIHDAMKASGWDTKKRQNYELIHSYWGLDDDEAPYETFTSYNRNGLEVAVRGGSLQFAGNFAKYIDNTVDLVSDEAKLFEVMDWFYEGGTCPILKTPEQIEEDRKEAKRQEFLDNVRYASRYKAYRNEITGAYTFSSLDDIPTYYFNDKKGVSEYL